MSTVKKPILLDETGKEMVSAMRTQNALLGAIARESINALTSWKDIQALVRQGLAKEIFHIGDQFIVPWKDIEADKTYDVPLDIVHFGDVELQDGEIVPAMFLQWHYTLPFSLQFDAPESTASAVKDPTDNVSKYGYNRWSHSAVRQFLNSKAGKDAWWTPKHSGDAKPDKLSTKAGFMTGFEDDFLSVIGPIKVTTALNTITDENFGNTEDTYDTFFLPSLEQMYAKPQLAGAEGDYFEYWKRATNRTSPNTWHEGGRNPGYITYDIETKKTPQSLRLRSAYRNSSYDTWYVYSDGLINGLYASSNCRCIPVCAVH